MLYWVIQITVISFILIFLIHHLVNFLKSTLTVPKIKDLVNTSTQKYENIYNIINKNNHLLKEEDYSLIELLPKKDFLPKKDEISMKNELKNFLKKQLYSSSETGTSIVALDSMNN